MTRRTVYLDKNALSNLCRSSDESTRRARRRLTSPLFERRPSLVVGHATTMELLKMAGHPQFQVEKSLLLRAATRWLLDLPTRARAEIDIYYGREADIFMPGDGWAPALDLEPGHPDLREVLDDHEATLAEFLRDEERRWPIVREKLGVSGKLGMDILADLTPHIRDWSKDFLGALARDGVLAQDRAEWPSIELLPSVWAYYSYYLSRLACNLGPARRIDANDIHDAIHYSEAACADDFVTDDKRFREYVSHCPEPRPRLLSLNEWVAEIAA